MLLFPVTPSLVATVQPCMEWIQILKKLQKRIFETVGPWLAASLEPLAHCWNVAFSKVFSTSIPLVDIHLNWLKWFHFFILKGGLLVILIDCMIFMSPVLDVTMMSMSTVSFLVLLKFSTYRILPLYLWSKWL